MPKNIKFQVDFDAENNENSVQNLLQNSMQQNMKIHETSMKNRHKSQMCRRRAFGEGFSWILVDFECPGGAQIGQNPENKHAKTTELPHLRGCNKHYKS